MQSCNVTWRVTGKCPKCLTRWMEPVHVLENPLAVVCSNCCPVHGVAEPEAWAEPPRTITGQQLKLL